MDLQDLTEGVLNLNVTLYVLTVSRYLNEFHYTTKPPCRPEALSYTSHALRSPLTISSRAFEAGSLRKYVLRQDGLLH